MVEKPYCIKYEPEAIYNIQAGFPKSAAVVCPFVLIVADENQLIVKPKKLAAVLMVQLLQEAQ